MDECSQCGYSYGALRRPDIAPELRTQARHYVTILTTVDGRRLRAHPRADVWSALEYACHVRDLHLVQGERVLQACGQEQPDFASMRREERVLEEGYNDQDPAAVAAEIEGAAATLAATLDGLDDGGWSRTGVYHWPTTALRTVEWIGRHTVHESVHHLGDIGRLLDVSP